MADDSNFSTSTTPTMQQLVDYLVDSMHDEKRVKQWETAFENAASRSWTIARGAAVKTTVPLAKLLGELIKLCEEAGEPALVPVLTTLAGRLIGRDVSSADLRRAANAETETPIGGAIADLAFSALTPPNPELEPGTDGARRFLSTLTQFTANAWMEGALFKLLATIIPDMDSFESVSELPHELVSSLGLGRLGRRALGPLADINIAIPLRWHLNKTYRPTLLGETAAIREFLSGHWSDDQLREELTRQGYSEGRIDALVRQAYKQLPLEDAMQLYQTGTWSADFVLASLREQGYDEPTAQLVFAAAQERREAARRDDSLAAVRAAYVDRRISDAEFSTFIESSIRLETERAAEEVAARIMRDVNTKRLSPAEARACVKAGILAVGDYRQALALDGYDEDAILALELLLRHELDAQQSIEDARAAAAADRALALAAKQAATDEKRQAIADALALKRRGPLSELERAFVTGLIPFSRVEEVLRAQFDDDTVDVYIDDLARQRQAYLVEQKKRDDAMKRADLKGLNVGQIEQAVYAGVLTVDEFRARVRSYGLSDADADVLTRTVAAKLADLVAAKKRQADAIAAAAKKGIDLGRLEQLVLRGLRPMTAYDAQLVALGFDDASRAGMRELLQSRLDEKAAADKLRTTTTKTDPARGLSLAQFRNAVLAGTKTVDEFQAFLVAERYTVEAQAVLVDELRTDVDAAEAARERRSQGDAASGRAGLSLSTIARAARLGIIAPDAYRDRLALAGYSDDDIALELELLVAEMATTKASRNVEAATSTPTSAHGLTLAQISSAVKAGAATRADFQSAAAAAGLDDDAIATLVAQLDDELAAVADAKGRRQQLVPALAEQGIDLADLEQQVRARTLTVAAFEQQLVTLGYPAADAQLVASLVETELR